MAGAGGDPTAAVPEVVGSVGGGVMERFGITLTLATTLSTRWKGGNMYTSRSFHGWRKASSKTACGSGIREQ